MNENIKVYDLENYLVSESELRSMVDQLKTDEIRAAGWAKYCIDLTRVNEHLEGLRAAIKKLKIERQNVLMKIEQVEDPIHKQLLYGRYIKGQDNATLAKEMGYYVTHISRLMRNALDEFEAL